MFLGKFKSYLFVVADGCHRLFFFLLFFFFVEISKSQVTVTPSELNFGTTSPSTDWIVDVHIENKGDKKDILLRHTFSHEYEVLFTSKTIMPDSSIIMRVKFIPRLKGIFKEDIQIYFASMNEPIILKVRADVEYKNPEDNIPCPDFSRLNADCCTDNMFLVEVVDAKTFLPIESANVIISEEGKERLKLKTNKDGKVSNTIPISYYRISASANGYLADSEFSYINNRKAYFRLELMRDPAAVTIEAPAKAVVLKDSTVIEDSEVVVVKNEFLPEDKFKPANFVFLLDVSSSMAQGEKLELMKGALNELIKVLRPNDKIAIVTYSSDAVVVLESTNGDQKVMVNEIVNNLKAAGSTSGAKGFKSAYTILRKEFIKDGNNQLMVITDGVFQPADQALITKQVKKSVKKNIITSVVGIQCVSFAALKLSEVSASGNGSFLSVKDDGDLKVLIEEMKNRTAK